MEGNLLLEQFSRYKKLELEASPFHFLLDANIELNPHQINAFCAAIQALKTGGIVLADEVGLGKTIEAGLVLKYVLESGAKRVLIALPASLRKQWELELEDKFGLESVILDRLTVEKDGSDWRKRLTDNKSVRIVLTSYDYSSKLMKRFPEVKWDFIIIDEAHNLRNVFHGTKRAKNLYELSKGIPKILLTATPLQNSLTDLHGLVSFIDQRIFGSEKVFNKRYIEGQDYSDLKRELSPVLYRTLRKDVAKYMNFKKRTCKTVDFTLSQDEIELYQRVNDFLKRELLYSIPTSNRGLIILVIRKLLASSSFALIETFEILKNRLEKLYEGSKSANAQEGFDLFWSYVEDEIDESGFEETEDEDTIVQKQFIQAELEEVNIIIDVAKRIKTNAKVNALKTAIQIAFDYQQEQGIPQKVVIFTESKRTQKYIAAELRKTGFDDEDILLFNGDFDDTMTKEIYKAWQVKNFGKANYGRSVEYKHAIVDYFRHNAKILICTDAGSEGLNLQFCNMVINYDLPWNPMKIEQRIGRCHRYGQEHDVVAINLLNTQNAADQRVYDILSKKFELFEGVFGASDIALGALESGTSFEKMVLQIYQTCDTTAEFNHNVEITSRMSSYKIPEKLNQLEITCDSKECLDTAIATNMIAVGMDVDRLGLMVVTGQPKQNSEYIQATSRIGRAFPGLVVTLYNAYRPRDLSHYENFTGYHSQLYRFVEGTTATPFSARARDRVMHALVISAIRLNFPNMANNPDAAAIGSLTKEQLDSVKSLIIDRLNIIKPSARTDAEEEIDRFIDWWKLQAAQTKPLRYYVVGTERYNRLMNPYDQPHDENEKATLRSMREVESSANMFYYTEE